MPAINDDVCCLPIQRIPHGIKLLQSRQGVGDVQQGAIPVMPSALMQQHRGDIQIHHPPGIMQPLAILRLYDDPTACRQYDPIDFGEFLNSLRLPTPEALLAFDFEDRRNRNTSPIDDLMIGVEERTRQTLGNLAPDCRFAGTH